jgi:hypothetical protein
MPDRMCKLIFKVQTERDRQTGEDVKLSTVEYVNLLGSSFVNTISINDLTRRILMRYNQWVSKDTLQERADLELLGLILYEIAFPVAADSNKNIRKAFETDFGFFQKDLKTARDNSRLRLTLIFHKNAQELANYPWEFLFMPTGAEEGFFLAGQRTELILTRFVPDVNPDLAGTRNQLRILIAYAKPQELGDTASPETLSAIESIKELHNGSSIVVEYLPNPTYKALQDKINNPPTPPEFGKPHMDASQPHILHFIGHGDSKLGLALMQEAEIVERNRKEYRRIMDAHWCNHQTIVDLFEEPYPRLVFLHACEGAKAETLDSFADLARQLAYAKIPAVVAMQYSITTRDASIFARKFYEELGKGRAIDEAVRAGRAQLGLPEGKQSWSDRRFGTPVVYLQSEKAIIELPQETSTPVSQAFDQYQKFPCPNAECTGKVFLGAMICTTCKHRLLLCPNCLSRYGEHRLMSRTIGMCSWCSERLPDETPRPAQPVAQSAADAIQTERPQITAAVRREEAHQDAERLFAGQRQDAVATAASPQKGGCDG